MPESPFAAPVPGASPVPGPFSSFMDQPTPGSIAASYRDYSMRNPSPDPAPQHVYGLGEVNFADPADQLAPKFLSSPDPMALDPDVYGTRTVAYGRTNGYPYTQKDVIGASVFGRGISADVLRNSEDGRRLLTIMEMNRMGVKRDFVDAMKDWGPSDFPFLSLFATVGKSISDARSVSDTMRKIQNGEACTDAELIKTRLYMAENEQRTNGTWGAMVGDLVRAAPGFMVEFALTGGMLSAARTATVRGAAEVGIHTGATRGAKILARETTDYLVKDAVSKAAGKSFADVAADAAVRKTVTSKVATQMFGFMKRPEFAKLYKGISDDALFSMAERRAAYEYGKTVARNSGGAMANGFNKFTQWLGQNMSRGLLDYGAWGTEDATVAFTRQSTAGRALADALGTFFVEAPLKGAVMMLPQQAVVKPVVGGVSSSTLGVQTAALMNRDKSLMDNAEAIGFGMDLMEYVSENTGRGLKSLLAAGGIGLERLGVKGLVRPLASQVTEIGGVRAVDDNVSIGGKIRQWVTAKFGTREQYLKNMQKDALKVVSERLHATPADNAALQAAIMANSTQGLRRELADVIGPDMGRFVEDTLSDAYKRNVKGLQYQSYARFSIANWMTKHQVGPETVMNMYERMGYDGVLGEMFEERYSDVVKGMLGLDERKDTKWFTEEHDFFANLKEAVKGIYPGFDQLLAEAVGFSVPMVTRAGVLRLQSAVGGEGKLAEIRAHLNVLDDALRSESSVRMTHGQYLKAHEYVMSRDQRELADLLKQRQDAESAGDQESVKELDRRIGTLQTVAQRRKDRHTAFTNSEISRLEKEAESASGDEKAAIEARVGVLRKSLDSNVSYDEFAASLGEQAKDVLDSMVVVPMLSNDVLADDTLYKRTPTLNSAQANEGLAGQAAIVEYAPELARRMYEAEAQAENETDKWYRKAAHKVVGLAGAFVTGDMSLAASNPVQWTARDMGLSARVTNALKDGFREEYLRAKGEMVRARVDGNEAFPSSVSVREVMDETQRRFAARARNIMSAEVAMHQLRSFADGKTRDQALAHVARKMQYQYSTDADGNVNFYRLTPDGSAVDESSVVTADSFYSEHKKDVDEAHDGLLKAVVDLMTRGSTKNETATRVMNAMTMDVRSDMLDVALYDAAMHLVGEGSLVKRVRVDGHTPLSVVMKSRSVATVDDSVLKYIASKGSVDEVDSRAFESVAHAAHFQFDGTEKDLAERNRKIFNIAKLANSTPSRSGSLLFSQEVVDDELADRMSANGRLTLRADLNADGTSYSVDFGYVTDGDSRGKRDIRQFADRAALDAEMKRLGYSADTANIVLTQAQLIESGDMFHMIRELGLSREYRSSMLEANSSRIGPSERSAFLHPMLRRDGTGKLLSAEQAEDLLRRELVAAEAGRHADAGTKERKAFEAVWGESGYMTLGERLLARHQVQKNSASVYTGIGHEYGDTLYTLSLKAGRLSSDSSDVYVPIDPLVNPDVTSGIVSGLLSNAYAFHPRLLRNTFHDRIADFIHQLDQVIDSAIADAVTAKDQELVAGLRNLRALCTAKTDRIGPDGKVTRGAGMSHNGFVRMAGDFVLFQAELDPNNPDRRAAATIAQQVRQLPAFADFANVVDLALGGSGFLSEVVRNAAGQDADVAAQTGVQRVLSYATGNASAFADLMKSSVPFGMSYSGFLDACVQHLDSMAKSGAPVMSEKEKADLRAKAREAEARPERAFSFIGNVIGVIKDALKSEKTVAADKTFAGFMHKLAEKALQDPNVTEAQRVRIRKELAALDAQVTTDSVEAAAAEYSVRIAELQAKVDAAGKTIARLVRENADLTAQLNAAMAAGNAAEVADTEAKMDENREAVKAAEAEKKILDDDITAARRALLGTLGNRAVGQMLDVGPSSAGNFYDEAEDGEEDPGLDSEDGSSKTIAFALNGQQSHEFALPEVLGKAVGLEPGQAFSMERGRFVESPSQLSRSQRRLACNIVVRSLLDGAEAVDEHSVEARIREFFPKTLPDSEVDAIVLAFRAAQSIIDSHNAASGSEYLTWDDVVRSGTNWTFDPDDKDDESISSDRFNEKSLAEYNNQSMKDFLALARWIMPDAGANLQAFLKLNREAVAEESDEASEYLRSILMPRTSVRGKTQAEHSALLMEALSDIGTSRVNGLVSKMLRREAGRPKNASGAFLLAYLSSLPVEARTRFGVLCADSVAATPIEFSKDTGMLSESHRSAAGKIPESLVTDSFSDLLGKSAKECLKMAAELEAEAVELGSSGKLDGTLEGNASAVAELFARHFGNASVIVRVLSSKMGMAHRRTLAKTMRTSLLNSVSYRSNYTGGPNEIAVVSTVASALRTLASIGGTVDRGTLCSVFVTAFATGRTDRAGLREAPRTCRVTDPLMSFFSTFVDAMPVTIMSAKVDQMRDRKGSSVAVAPRDLVPLVARWLYADGKTRTVIKDKDGKEHPLMSFRESCQRFFNVTDEKVIAECRQNATWPDEARTPVCAKCVSTSLSAREVYDACERSYKNESARTYWVPLYAGDHSSSTLFQIPSNVVFGDFAPVATTPSDAEEAKAKPVEVESAKSEYVPELARLLEGVEDPMERKLTIAQWKHENPGKPWKAEVEEPELKQEPDVEALFDEASAHPHTSRPSYHDVALAASDALGLGLLYTDAKRAGVSSLEAQGAGLVGHELTPDGEDRYGENRVHIMCSYTPNQNNEVFHGSTYMSGYGAKALKLLSRDSASSTVKAHIISTYGYDLFFSKSLCLATDPASRGDFLEGSAGRLVMDYIRKYRGTADTLSTDIFTDFDSYKIGAASSKAVRAIRKDGFDASIMEIVFERLCQHVGAKPGTKLTEEQEKRLKSEFSKMTGDALDEVVGFIRVADYVRNAGVPEDKKLSEVLPGVVVNFIDGFNGPALDMSYREDGAMGYIVANVSHDAKLGKEPGKSPRNYEFDSLGMIACLSEWKGVTGGRFANRSKTATSLMDMIADWGLIANTVYSHPGFQKSLTKATESILEQIRNGEFCADGRFGQNIGEELARQVWSKIREASNLPMNAIDAPLVACGGQIGEDGKLVSLVKSRMHRAMMKGSELFTAEESKFYGVDRRLALCNVNNKSLPFRYGWFLNLEEFERQFGSVDDQVRSLSDYNENWSSGQRIAKAIAAQFTALRDLSEKAESAVPEKRTEAEKELHEKRLAIASSFVDHHNVSIAKREKYVDAFMFEDLFMAGEDGEDAFDLSAVQFDGQGSESDPDAGDQVFNDASGQYHVFLGGTMFGLPRTPSYNGSMWLQTVRAGLPVTEIESEGENGEKTWQVGRDAMVQPDPFTMDILGCDNDGDKSKLYMYWADKGGRVSFSTIPSPSGFQYSDFIENDATRAAYLDSVASNGAKILEECRYNPDTGEIDALPAGSNDPDRFYRISERFRRRIGNAFARNLFNLARMLPTEAAVDGRGGFTVRARQSDPMHRTKFIGGVASSPTGAFSTTFRGSVVNKKTLKSAKAMLSDTLKESTRPGILDKEHTIRDPKVASDVSTSGDKASDARASVVSFARTMLTAWFSGYFRGDGIDSLFPPETTAAQFIRFMYRFDGISNATFDDLKEQLCARFGWTAEMLDTVLSDLVINAGAQGRHLPTTADEFIGVISAYAKDIRDGGPSRYMLYASDQVSPEGKAMNADIRNTFFGTGDLDYRITKSHAMSVFGISTEPPETGGIRHFTLPLREGSATTARAAVAGLAYAFHGDKYLQSRILAAMANDMARNNGFGPTLGRLYYLVTSALGSKGSPAKAYEKISAEEASKLASRVSEMPEAKAFAEWILKRSAIARARSFTKSVSYLTADPGDTDAASAESRIREAYKSMNDFVDGNDVRTKLTFRSASGERTYDTRHMLDRMHAAAVLAFRLGNGVQGIATGAMKAARRRDDALVRLAADTAVSGGAGSIALAAKLVLRDAIPGYDRMGLEASARQVKHLSGFFVRQAEIAAHVPGSPFRDGRELLDAVTKMSSGVAARYGVRNGALPLRRAVESLFAVAYELMSTSTEFADPAGNHAAAYLRAASDGAFGESVTYDDLGRERRTLPYGQIGRSLQRIMAMFRANDEDAVARVREEFGDMMSGKAYSGKRKVNGAAARCASFSLSVETVMDYLVELAGWDAVKASGVRDLAPGTEEFNDAVARALADVDPSKWAVKRAKGKKVRTRVESARCADVCDAFAALQALGGEITPAVLYGQLIPMYTLMTSRTMGAPTPSSPSVINLYPTWLYRTLSEYQEFLDRTYPDLSDALVATSWANVRRETAVRRNKVGKLFVADEEKMSGPIEKFGQSLTKGVTLDNAEEDRKAVTGAMKELRDALRKTGDTEARKDPDYRNTVDFVSDGIMGNILDFHADMDGSDAKPDVRSGSDTLTGTAEYDEATARTAAVMGSLLSSWASVEYSGGKTFVIRGNLRGNAGAGKRAVIVVDTTGTYGMCDTEEQVRALANDYAYGESLCAAADLGITAGQFALLSEKTRMDLVRAFKVGAATSNRVAWSSTGRGIATLVGAISLPEGKGGTKLYHEYFHAMMRMFDACGLFTEQDVKELEEKYGGEEQAAEAFRKWVEGKTDPEARDARSVFQKIFDVLRAFFEALAKGFNYRDQPEDFLFNMALHGVAQASDSRIAEVEAKSGRLPVASVLKKAFVLNKHSVEADGRMRPEDRLIDEALGYLHDTGTSVGSIEALEDVRGYWDPVREPMRMDAEETEIAVATALADPSATPDSLRMALARAVEARNAIGASLGVTILNASRNANTRYAPGEFDPDKVDTDRFERVIGRASGGKRKNKLAGLPKGGNEARDEEVRAAVNAGVSPVVRVSSNEFHAASHAILRCLEEGLRTHGSWESPMQHVVNKYNCPTWANNEDEARDRAAIMAGLRQAMYSVNPKAAKAVGDRELMDSLAFRAALVMYHTMESSFLHQTRREAGTGRTLPGSPAGDGYAIHAGSFQVSAWLMSSDPVSPERTVARARDEIASASGATGDRAAKKELRDLMGIADRLMGLVGSPAALMEYRKNQGMSVFNEVMPDLRSRVTKIEFDGFGRIVDFEPSDPSMRQVYSDHRFQNALKSLFAAAYQTAAMAKFMQETGTVQGSASDFEFHKQMMTRWNLPENVTPAEWAATQAVGDSNLCDNTGLVDYMDQSMFIANNAEAWLQSLVRKSFGAKGNIGQMLADENHEYGAIKLKIGNLENFFAMMFGNNVEAGGKILKVLEHKAQFAMEEGAIVHKVGDTYVKFDNYNRKTCDVTMTNDNLRDVDLFLKMVASHAGGDWATVTGVDDLRFSRDMVRDRAFYDLDVVLERWNGGKPAKQMNAIEMALVRASMQIPASVLRGENGLAVRFADACVEALSEADDYMARREADGAEAAGAGSARYNSYVLDALVRRGLIMAHNRERATYEADKAYGHDGRLPKYTKGTLVIANDEIDRMFRDSEAYAKLTDPKLGNRRKEWLDRDYVAGQFMGVYREATDFVKRHPWVVHGDGRYFNSFGTKLPFWRGSGVFMYDAVRVDRDRKVEAEKDLTRDEAVLVKILRDPDASVKAASAAPGDAAGGSAMLEMVASYYGVQMRGQGFADAIAEGKFERGSDLAESTGLVLSRTATYADLAKAVYYKSLERVWGHQVATEDTGVSAAQKVIDLYEDSMQTAGEMLGGSQGMTDTQMYRLAGTLPANYQIGHKVHVAVDGITNAVMSRAVLANLLMTPAHDGAPVYYADPSDIARETSGLPDAFWDTVAKWWNDYNGLTAYDPGKSGIENARAVYAAVKPLVQRKGRKVGEGDDQSGRGKVSGARYEELSGSDGDIASVSHWLVREDDQLGEESSALNVLGGGEAKGYLKQFLHASRVLGFGGAATRATLHRCLSWSKSMSVSFSFFFPLATKWESPIGAVGAIATIGSNSRKAGEWIRKNPELFAGIQKMFGGRGWVTKDFLGFQDIMDMMDSNDPFLAEMYAWANALGITVSTNLVNPMEPTKGIVASDVARLKRIVRDNFGAEAAGQFGRIADLMLLRSGEKAFNYALNATKLAVVAQLAMKLRYAAQAKGKAFDPVRDLRRYSGYINAEIGGIDPLRYAWAHPFNRGLMNTLMFSWQWTRGAWEAGGGNVIEDMLFGGHSVTKEERALFIGRWARMFGAVMIGAPALFQMVSMLLAKCLYAAAGGGGDDDDTWFTWRNESKTRWTAFDITPLLRAIEKFDDTRLGGVLRKFKEGGSPFTAAIGGAAGAILGGRGGNWLTGLVGGLAGAGAGAAVPSLVPMYTGNDAANSFTKHRRYYMHFGKQGWEFFRWFDDAKSQFMSKLSMPTQRILEGIFGRSLSYIDRSLPWEDMGQFERWLNPTTDGALFNLAEAFLPFSVGSITRNGDAGILPIFGPVQMGESKTGVQKRLEKALTAWARNDRRGYRFGGHRMYRKGTAGYEQVSDILRDARLNGLDPQDQLNKALGQVLSREYGEFFKELPEDITKDFDTKKLNEAARRIERVGGKKANVMKSIRTRYENQHPGSKWEKAPFEYRQYMEKVTSMSMSDPFTAVGVPGIVGDADGKMIDY